MLSLLSVKSDQEVREWHRKLLGKLIPADSSIAGPSGQALSWMVEPKVDGVALSLLYRDGQLVQVPAPQL
jgi:DNA ligase (NAD+)